MIDEKDHILITGDLTVNVDTHLCQLKQDDDAILLSERQRKDLVKFLQNFYKWQPDTAHIYDLSSMD